MVAGNCVALVDENRYYLYRPILVEFYKPLPLRASECGRFGCTLLRRAAYTTLGNA